ncbi:MAG TPA: polyphosphate kinase 2 [Cellvibrio sp.]|nr:polyphosphate kinase 2 [Cellvibrio sp.]
MKDDEQGKKGKKTSTLTKSGEAKNAPAKSAVAKKATVKNSTPKKTEGEIATSVIAKMKRKDYEIALEELHVELVKLQEWVVHKKLKVCIVFEGRDTAGKGGTIKAITERVSPRVFRVVALPSPTEREKSQMYMQRYIRHFPAGGEIVIFDRSWYNRAGVERVMGFCTEEQSKQFLDGVPLFERAMVDNDIILIKLWLEVSEAEQTARLKSRMDDRRKTWKLSPMDLLSYSRWYDYSRARDDMFRATDTGYAPWYAVHTDDKRRGRLNIIRHILTHIPYEEMPHEKVVLPKRQKPGNYVASTHVVKYLEEYY